ncbi:MAG: M56 family metallopeptidase [Bryobacteraceae bacterium]
MNALGLTGKVTLLLLAATAAAWLLRKRSASHRAAVWQSALTAAVLLPLLSLLLPSWRVPLTGAFDLSLVSISAGAASFTPSPSLPVIDWIVLAWALGFVFCGVRIVAGNWMVWRAVQHGRPQQEEAVEIPVVESACIRTPLLWGVVRPRILVPPGWDSRSSSERALILSHEAAHARRSDTRFQLVSQLASAIYWFHPLVWMATARLRRESEMACDDEVLRSGALASSYADLLLRTAASFGSGPSMGPVTLAMARPSQVQVRIRSVLEPGAERAPLSGRGGVFAILLLFAVMLPVAAMQNGAEDDRVYKIGGDVLSPRVIEKQEPAYTQEARDAGIEGTVMLAIEIDKEGRVRRAEVVRGLDTGLDQSAMDSIRTWVFEPARKAGKPVIVAARVEVNFRLQ